MPSHNVDTKKGDVRKTQTYVITWQKQKNQKPKAKTKSFTSIRRAFRPGHVNIFPQNFNKSSRDVQFESKHLVDSLTIQQSKIT